MPPKVSKLVAAVERERERKSKQASKINLDLEDLDFNKQLIKPDDQLDLTENELGEEIAKKLSSENTNVSKNLVIYSFKEGGFVPLPLPPNTVTLFEFQGTSLHIDSEEAQAQIIEMGDDYIPPAEDPVEPVVPDAPDANKTTNDEGNGEGGADGEDGDGGGDGGGGEEGADGDEEEGVAAPPPDAPAPPVATSSRKRLKLINQFNYCERAALTYTNPSRSVETQTIPPPRSGFGANVVQWVIYDWYAEDFEQSQKEKEKDKKAVVKKDLKKKSDRNQASEEINKKYLQCWQILERMVNQNIFDDIAQDYRYYEDPSDEFREEEGTLLPLWTFMYEKTKKLNVTDMCFNTLYYDLFAVCFGSLDFMKQGAEGYVCFFTIKNPSFPDFRIQTESGVMCCDIHPKYPYLFVIGMYDGNVAVYNLQVNLNDPIYLSKGVNGKHSDVIWEVKWGLDMTDGEINFYSISGDGRIFNWVLMQSKLTITPIITLYLDKEQSGGLDGNEIKLKGCGTSMIFHPNQPEIFLVGTEEGFIYKCSTAYSSKYLMTYHAHYLPIYRIDFNKYNSNIFASCSGDWRVKIWEDMRSDPLFIFDLGASVGDFKWAPYSSTVLAAVTNEGKVFVFDINVNKYKAICVQQVVARKNIRLTRIAFNQKLPFIIVGDDKGIITSLKLSPNLRLKVKLPKKNQLMDQNVLQVQKLEKLLSLVRELPDEETIEKEAATSVAS